MNMKRKLLLLLSLTGLLTLTSPVLTASAAWVNTIAGKKYTQKAAPGYVTGWQQINGSWYYFSNTGIMQTGWITVSGKTYFLTPDGVRQTGWIKSNGKFYYLNNNGVMQKSKWVDNRYLLSSGACAFGFITIGDKTYYLDPSTGIRQTGKIKYNGNLYYFNSKGILQKDKWVCSGNCYASGSGALLKGVNAVGDAVYFFNNNGKKVTQKLKTIDSNTYYFMPDGTAAKNMRVKIGSNFYYFLSSGIMATDTWISNKYFADSDGVLTEPEKPGDSNEETPKQTGWETQGDNKYYYDSDGSLVTGWQTISGSKYYFAPDGVMQTGVQTINGSKYYFYPDGRLAVSVTIVVGSKQYTINSSGIITDETNMHLSGDDTGTQIANFALQYVGNPYVYGGTSLTNGADCSGFVMTVFANFNIKLLRVADDQMHGPSSSYLKQGYAQAFTVSEEDMRPGDLIFYGYGDYASHVAIYIGDGKIVHASNSQPYPAGGIKISNYDYNTPIKIVRYWN